MEVNEQGSPEKPEGYYRKRSGGKRKKKKKQRVVCVFIELRSARVPASCVRVNVNVCQFYLDTGSNFCCVLYLSARMRRCNLELIP